MEVSLGKTLLPPVDQASCMATLPSVSVSVCAEWVNEKQCFEDQYSGKVHNTGQGSTKPIVLQYSKLNGPECAKDNGHTPVLSLPLNVTFRKITTYKGDMIQTWKKIISVLPLCSTLTTSSPENKQGFPKVYCY